MTINAVLAWKVFWIIPFSCCFWYKIMWWINDSNLTYPLQKLLENIYGVSTHTCIAEVIEGEQGRGARSNHGHVAKGSWRTEHTRAKRNDQAPLHVSSSGTCKSAIQQRSRWDPYKELFPVSFIAFFCTGWLIHVLILHSLLLPFIFSSPILCRKMLRNLFTCTKHHLGWLPF